MVKEDIKLKFKWYCRQHHIDEVDEDIVNDYMFHNNFYGNNIFTMLLNTKPYNLNPTTTIIGNHKKEFT